MFCQYFEIIVSLLHACFRYVHEEMDLKESLQISGKMEVLFSIPNSMYLGFAAWSGTNILRTSKMQLTKKVNAFYNRVSPKFHLKEKYKHRFY